MAGASHEKSFGHVDLEMLVRNLSDTVQAVKYVGLKPLKWSGNCWGRDSGAEATREDKTTQARRV